MILKNTGFLMILLRSLKHLKYSEFDVFYYKPILRFTSNIPIDISKYFFCSYTKKWKRIKKFKCIQVDFIKYFLYSSFFLPCSLSLSLSLSFTFLISPNCLRVLTLSDHILFKLREKKTMTGENAKDLIKELSIITM